MPDDLLTQGGFTLLDEPAQSGDKAPQGNSQDHDPLSATTLDFGQEGLHGGFTMKNELDLSATSLDFGQEGPHGGFTMKDELELNEQEIPKELQEQGGFSLL